MTSSATAQDVVSEGSFDAAGVTVWWRLGRDVQPRRASGLARAWARELVEANHLFPWRGYRPTPAGTKPRFHTDAAVDHSISHRRDAVLVAVAAGGAVGADVEVAPYDAFASPALRRRMLSPHERSELHGLDEASAIAYLARVWTAKEAIVKATGRGLAQDFRGLHVGADARLPHLDLHSDLEACIAVIDDAGRPRLTRLDPPAPAPMTLAEPRSRHADHR